MSPRCEPHGHCTGISDQRREDNYALLVAMASSLATVSGASGNDADSLIGGLEAGGIRSRTREARPVDEALRQAGFAQTRIVRQQAHALVVALDRDDTAVAEHFYHAKILD